MPLYMDIHTVDSDAFSVEDVVKAHMEDLAIQEKFKVTQLKYWVNVEAKTLFCLMTGPDKDSCNRVHKESHGNTACNIIEVSDDEFNLYLGIGNHKNDLALTVSGDFDSGYRTLLFVNLFYFTNNELSYYNNKICKAIREHQGILIPHPDNSFMASFILASQAISCALDIKRIIESIPNKVEFVLALSSGRPVDEKGETLFEETKNKVRSICAAGSINSLYLDAATKALSTKESVSFLEVSDFTVVPHEDFTFLHILLQVIEENLLNPDFKSNSIYGLLNLSKSKASKKIFSLTGMAPNGLVQEYRLRKSLERIISKTETVAETAYSTGFNSPTYYTRSFKKRFGVLPTQFPQ